MTHLSRPHASMAGWNQGQGKQSIYSVNSSREKTMETDNKPLAHWKRYN